jgi:hypothetical protein
VSEFRWHINQAVKVDGRSARVDAISDRGTIRVQFDDGEYEWWAYEALDPAEPDE